MSDTPDKPLDLFRREGPARRPDGDALESFRAGEAARREADTGRRSEGWERGWLFATASFVAGGALGVGSAAVANYLCWLFGR